MPSSRTPEGEPNTCAICGQAIRIEPSTFPGRDAPCPRCGSLLQFDDPKDASIWTVESGLSDLLERIGSLPLLPTVRRMVVDLGENIMMTSAVLSKLIVAHLKARAAGLRLAVCSVHPEVLEVFRITKLDKVLEIVEA